MAPLVPLSGMVPENYAGILPSLPAFRYRQIFKWISSGIISFEQMNNLPKEMRIQLAEAYSPRACVLGTVLKDEDGTQKLQLILQDGLKVEAVLLTDVDGRKTACLSSQAGCPMQCAFCKTATLGLARNLSAAEMVDQFLYLKDIGDDISNIVVMGMGEPLLNLENLRAMVSFLTHTEGLGISKRRITVSTSGIVTGILEIAEKGPDIRLAVSLTSAREELRKELMPIAAHSNLSELKEAIQKYQKEKDRRVTLEVVLLSGLNTGIEEAEAIYSFSKGLDVIINLIPWNPVEGLGLNGMAFKEPSIKEVRGIEAYLLKKGLNVSTRFKRGRSVSGACGQLGDTCGPLEHA